ncbi:MAG TPA: Ig-like domain-containing protein, partial [Bacteroidales bacterium]|nr:Ig-like domain-containing protein [Bacteroidales bacterium]
MKMVRALSTIMFIGMVIQLQAQNAPITTAGTVTTSASTASVPITAEDFPVLGIGTIALRVLYDPLIASATSVVDNLGGNLATNLTVPGLVLISWYTAPCLTSLNDNSILFYINFNKVTIGTSSLTFDYTFLGGNGCQYSCGSTIYNDSPGDTYYIPGSLTFEGITSPITTAPVLQACPGASISVPVTVTGFSNICAISLHMNYNFSVLTFVSGSNTSGFPGLTFSGSTPGLVIIGGNTTTGQNLSDGSTLFTLNFTYIGGSTALTWDDDPDENCEYAYLDTECTAFNDDPPGNYYIAGSVSPAANANAGTVSGTSPLCIGGTATYSSNGDAGGTWTSTNTSVATVNSSTGLVSALAAGTTNITYTVNTGCGAPVSAYKALTVNANVSAGTVSGTSPLCIGESAFYTSNGTSGGTWSSSNETVASVSSSTGYVTAAAAGTTNITYTVSTGCGAPVSAFKTLTVSPDVTAGTVSGASPLCIGQTAAYTSNGTSGGTWASTQPAVASVNSSMGLVTALVAGNTDITYTVNTGCGAPVSAYKTLTVSPNANAGTVSGASPLCIGATATYNSNGDPGGSWSSTNTGVATVNPATGEVSALSAGTTNITYTVSTGCNAPGSSYKVLIVNPDANAGTVSGTSPLCIGETTTYTSDGDAGGSWWSSNPEVATVNSTTGEVTALMASSTFIYYSISTGCGAPVHSFKLLQVNPNANPGSVSGTTPLCVGQSATYNSNGEPGGTWSSTNPAVATRDSQTGLVTAWAVGTTDITYTLSTGCGTPVSSFRTLTVTPPSVGGTAQAIPSSICYGSSTSIYLSDEEGSIQWQWSPNGYDLWSNVTDGNGGTTDIYTTSNLTSTIYYRALVSLGSCAPAYSNVVMVTVHALPTAGITNNTGTTVLTCTTTSISVTATGGVSYQWNGGSTPTTANNTFTAPGIYTVIVTDDNGCSDTENITITQNITPPTAGITNNTGTTVLTCTTTSISVTATGGVSYSWDGGATPATAANSFTSPGTYTVTVTGANGCTDTESITITQNITPPTAGITNNTGITELTCTTTSISVTATGGVNYLWDGGATPATAANSFTSPGTYMVTVTGANGCTDTESITITQNITPPTAGITNNTGTTVLTCVSTSISVTATGGVDYQWDGGTTPTTAANNFTSPG